MMFMGRVSLCEREMSKRMENKEKSEKRIRKTEKERNLDLVVPFLQKSRRRYSELQKLRSRYSELQKSCSRYSVYDGNMVIGTQSMTNYYGWYLGYSDRSWAIRSIVDMPGTRATMVDCW